MYMYYQNLKFVNEKVSTLDMSNDKCPTVGIHMCIRLKTIPRGKGKVYCTLFSIRTAFNIEVLHWQMFWHQCGKKTPLQGCAQRQILRSLML